MKTKPTLLIVAALFAVSTVFAAPTILPVTYQGRLFDGTNAGDGQFEIRFGIFSASAGGSELESQTNIVTVANGLFATVLNVDRANFPDPFGGNLRWLEIGVRTNGSGDDFTLLSARQPLTFSPYAIRASVASLAENLPELSVTGLHIQEGAITAEKIDAGQVVKSVNGLRDAVSLAAGANTTITPAGNTLTIAGTTDWHLTGNAGTTPGTHFIGTTDNQPLEFRVNGQRAFLLQMPTVGAPMVIGGSLANGAAPNVSGATIAGGYSNTLASAAYESTIGGGAFNSIRANANQSFIGGGAFNTVGTNSVYGTISGGGVNTIGSFARYATISGGASNTVRAMYGVVSGGFSNIASGEYSFVGGGRTNLASGFIAAVMGGERNIAAEIGAFVAGGFDNRATDVGSTIGGGYFNSSSGNASTVSGGWGNDATGAAATVPGGRGNIASGGRSFAAGSAARALHDGTFVWSDDFLDTFASTAPNQFLIRASGGVGINTTIPNARFHVTGSDFNPIQMLENIQDMRTALALKTPFYTWHIGQNSPPGSPSPVDTFYIYDASSNRTRVVIDVHGRMGLGTNSPAHPLHLANGAHCTTAGAWTSVSDRNAKEDFAPIDPQEVLAKVSALPIAQWKYKVEGDGVKHIGPTAQDFRAAFGLGETETAITTVDADGVALAAIQGLNQKLRQKETEIAELKQAVTALKELIQAMNQQLNGGANENRTGNEQ